MEAKVCTECGEEKPLDEFNNEKRGKFGKAAKCRECISESNKIRYKEVCGEIKEINITEKVCIRCGVKKLLTDFGKRKDSKDGRKNECKECNNARHRKRPPKENLPEGTKRCSGCGKIKNVDEFYKDGRSNDGLLYICIDCHKERRENNKDYSNKRQNERYHSHKNDEEYIRSVKEYYINNAEDIKSRANKYYHDHKEEIGIKLKEYREENREAISERSYRYKREVAKYSTYSGRLTVEESPICIGDDELWCKCTYCGDYFPVLNKDVNSRIKSLNGIIRGENRLYCGDKCKDNCPIFGQNKYPRGFKQPDNSRCNQNRVRQILLELQQDESEGYNWCEKCGDIFAQEDLFFHHNIPIGDDYTEYDNAAHYMLVCKDHHEHKGCLGNPYE